MRPEIAIAHQFGYADFEVYRAAQLLVARPFGEACIIWRRSCQCDQTDMLKPIGQLVEAFPPLPA